MRICASTVALEAAATSSTTRVVEGQVVRSAPAPTTSQPPASPPPATRHPSASPALAAPSRTAEHPEEPHTFRHDLEIVKDILHRMFGVQFDEFFDDLITGVDKVEAAISGYDAEHAEAHGRRPETVQEQPPRSQPTRELIHGHDITTQDLRVTSSGCVQTADGRTIDFHLDMHMHSQAERDVLLERLTNGAYCDPLGIDLAGGPVQLTHARFSCDVDGNGANETVAWATGTSGFVGYDANGNGTVDAGELVGARSGNAFADLAKLDDDHNGWIDEADAAWGKLSFVQRDEAGTETVKSLGEAGVGALSVTSVATPFAVDGGRVTDTGVALTEDGHAVATQHVDLAA